jgi:hypothetical protein
LFLSNTSAHFKIESFAPYKPGIYDYAMADDNDEELPSKEELLSQLGVSEETLHEMLREVQSEPEIMCAHCGNIPDGVIKVSTDDHEREHRICNTCAEEFLRWL